MLRKKIFVAFIYFFAATAITWWFIEASPLYTNLQQKLLSFGIAGAKWGIQIIAAWLLLKDRRAHFIKNISFTCLVGSLVLLPYTISSYAGGNNGKDFFIGSLLIAVAIMIFLYAVSVKNAGIKIYWWLGWLFCLAIAILLQLTVVFHVL